MRPNITLYLKVIAITCLVSACNSIDKKATNPTTELTLTNVNKVNLNGRSYLVETPTTHFDKNKSYKLLLAFHGSMQGAQNMQQLANLESASHNYLVVYPQSEVEEWNEGCECNKPHRLGIDDLGFVEEVVDDVKTNYNIIENELYAVGFSQGGLFTQNLMCNSALKFTAIASVAAAMSEQLSEQCHILNPTNYLMIHGTLDNTLPYTGLKHANFPLIPSESAIKLIAAQNAIESPVESDTNANTITYTYSDTEHTNELVAIQGGAHSWSFKDYDTTNKVIEFFDRMSTKKLDTHSSLFRVNLEKPQDVHVRSMGLEHSGPAIILLSGFNKNFHSDGAWYSLLQPLLAKSHRVHVIERFGNGFSSQTDQPSYASFVSALDKTLAALNEKEIVIVSFASANILAHLWQNMPEPTSSSLLKGMVWIDPDILLPHSISLYQDWPVAWYKRVEEQLIPHIADGNWTPRTIDKLAAERAEHAILIPVQYSEVMDWSYYDLIAQDRLTIVKQLTRAHEIINYHDDLIQVTDATISTSVPITVIDTDFESADIATADADFVPTLTKWQQEGTQWSKLISKQSNGHYIPLTDSTHMAVFQHPDKILEAINAIKNK